MSTRPPENHADHQESLEPSPGNALYIVGPSGLQNEAIASCLRRETGNECFLLEDINRIRQQDLNDPGKRRLVLLDCQGKDPETILAELIPYLKGRGLGNHVVLFNVRRDLGIERRCILEGIDGFFYEQDPLDTFLKGVRAVFNGELWLTREIMTKCIREGAHHFRVSKTGSAILTTRQTEILALVVVGLTNDEIADRLCISPHTVKPHLYKIFKKINVPNRMQAALWSAQNL